MAGQILHGRFDSFDPAIAKDEVGGVGVVHPHFEEVFVEAVCASRPASISILECAIFDEDIEADKAGEGFNDIFGSPAGWTPWCGQEEEHLGVVCKVFIFVFASQGGKASPFQNKSASRGEIVCRRGIVEGLFWSVHLPIEIVVWYAAGCVEGNTELVCKLLCLFEELCHVIRLFG